MPINYGVDKAGYFVKSDNNRKFYYDKYDEFEREQAIVNALRKPKIIKLDTKNEPANIIGKAIKEQLKAQGITKQSKGKQYRVKYPHQIERQYRTALVRYISPLFALTKKYIYPEITRIKNQFLSEAGRIDSYSDEISDVVGGIELRWSKLVSDNPSKQLVLPFATATELQSKNEFNKEAKSLLGINPIMSKTWLPGLRNSWVTANVGLITSISSQYFTQIEGIIRRGVESGTSTKKIQKELQNRFSVTRNRARLIARDQIGKYYGSMHKERSVDLGITHFRWITAGDERVRTEHRLLDRRRFSWKMGADGLYPGLDIQCRCIAENDYSVFFED